MGTFLHRDFAPVAPCDCLLLYRNPHDRETGHRSGENVASKVLPKRREHANLGCGVVPRREIHESNDRAQADRGEEVMRTSAALGAHSARGR
jgi:hypothetical protein